VGGVGKKGGAGRKGSHCYHKRVHYRPQKETLKESTISTSGQAMPERGKPQTKETGLQRDLGTGENVRGGKNFQTKKRVSFATVSVPGADIRSNCPNPGPMPKKRRIKKEKKCYVWPRKKGCPINRTLNRKSACSNTPPAKMCNMRQVGGGGAPV